MKIQNVKYNNKLYNKYTYTIPFADMSFVAPAVDDRIIDRKLSDRPQPLLIRIL